MQWSFLVTASGNARIQARIFQILDHHGVTVHSFTYTAINNTALMQFAVEADDGKAHRIEALVRRLYAVKTVNAFPVQANLD
jgi:predicted amino acid-binding ACT domain protein